jgi:methanol metabolism-related c-type cytochrome
LEEQMMARLQSISAAATILAIAGTLSAGLAQQGNGGQEGGQNGKPYVVKDGKVDQHTYNGWRRYTESCMRCHGPDGAGSSYAPDLTDSLKHMTEEQFKDVVINGRQNVSQASESVMPAFGEVEDVVLYLDDIYAYLKARSDGMLGRGRPERFDRS